jgi:hypothetical protein
MILAPGEFIFGNDPFEAAGAAGGLGNVEEFIGPGQILLGLLADGNVVERDDQAIAGGVRCVEHRDADVAPNTRAVLADVALFAGVGVSRAVEQFLQTHQVASHGIRFGNLHEGHLAQFVGAVAKNLGELRVDAQKTAFEIDVGQADAGSEKSGFEMVVEQIEGLSAAG